MSGSDEALVEQEITKSKSVFVISQESIQTVLDWTYEKAVSGIPGLDSAADLAKSYMKSDKSAFDQANELIRWQNSKAATSGFVTGIGGFATLPIALPANVTSVLYIQIRMIAAIAFIGGHDLRDDRVRTLVYSCLVKNGVKESLKSVGIKVGNRAALNAVKAIPGKALTAINQRTGMLLVTKFGQTGVINLGKMVPVLGGVIGGTFDYFSTRSVGKQARDAFVSPPM